MPHRFLPHTADIRVEVTAPSLGALLSDCAAVVRELVAGDSPVSESDERSFNVRGFKRWGGSREPAESIFEFVRALLEAFEIDGFIPARVKDVYYHSGDYTLVIRGERFDPAKHATQPEVKALTRHGLEVRATPDSWRAEMVFDV